jgi:hypothetical protein
LDWDSGQIIPTLPHASQLMCTLGSASICASAGRGGAEWRCVDFELVAEWACGGALRRAVYG